MKQSHIWIWVTDQHTISSMIKNKKYLKYSLDLPRMINPNCLFTSLLTNGSTDLLDKLTCSYLVKKFPAFYTTPRFIAAFTSARHLSLSWARSTQFMPLSYFPKIRLNITLPSTPGSSKWSLALRFPTKTLYVTLLSPIRATCPAYLILLDWFTRIIFGEW